MTLAEFKAWFEGFIEDIDARPTEKQWKRIKARVKEIDGTAITKEIWYRDWKPYWAGPYWAYSTNVAGGQSANYMTTYDYGTTMPSAAVKAEHLYTAGKSEYESMTT